MVLASLVVQTVTDQGPVIFLQLAQTLHSGEVDVSYVPNGQVFDHENAVYWSLDRFLNYTTIFEQYGTKYNLAPRMTYKDYTNYPWRAHWSSLTDAYMLPDYG